MRKIPIGLELYSVREHMEKDMPSTVRAVAKMGYEGVEFFGGIRYTADEVNAILKETGLALCGWHTPYDLLAPDKLEETLAFFKAVGNKYCVVPWYSADTAAQWLDFALDMERIAQRMEKDGIRLGYHNHAHEFQEVDGQVPWSILFDNAKHLMMQMDTGNALEGGALAVDSFKKYPGISDTVHLKPYSLKEGVGFDTMIGEDDCDWKGIFDCLNKDCTQWMIVEYESTKLYDEMTAVDLCLKKIREML